MNGLVVGSAALGIVVVLPATDVDNELVASLMVVGELVVAELVIGLLVVMKLVVMIEVGADTAAVVALVLLVVPELTDVVVASGIFWNIFRASGPPQNCMESPAHAMVQAVEGTPAPLELSKLLSQRHSLAYSKPANV